MQEKNHTEIKDYEFIYNINALFEKKIILYGAGVHGKRMYALLKAINVDVECFCDKNPSVKKCLPAPVISMNELKQRTTDDSSYFIIVSSGEFFEEIIADLTQMKIQAYICTWHAVRIGIELHIHDSRFSEEFRNDFLQRKKICFNNNTIHFELLNQFYLSVYPYSILVYLSPKVGSSTIYEALNRADIAAVHTHSMAPKTGIPQIDAAKDYYMEKCRKDGVKIISVVREPVARALSYFMQGFRWEFIWDDRCQSSDLEAEARRWVMKSLEENEEFVWFDKEIKEFTGIDVYQYPFDKEAGYSWIKENNIEILLLKAEKLNDNIDLIRKFVGYPDLELVSKNVGDKKSTKYIYKQLKKNFKLPASVIKQQFENNTRLDHFYTKEEKQSFLEKWQSHIL